MMRLASRSAVVTGLFLLFSWTSYFPLKSPMTAEPASRAASSATANSFSYSNVVVNFKLSPPIQLGTGIKHHKAEYGNWRRWDSSAPSLSCGKVVAIMNLDSAGSNHLIDRALAIAGVHVYGANRI